MSSISDAKLLWQQIVSATSGSKFQESQGLNNRLFLDLNKSFNIRTQLTFIFKIAKHFTAFPQKLVVNTEKGKVLFYFPFNTSANLASLLPVYVETHKQTKVGLVIKAQNIALFKNTLCKENVYKFTNYFQRFRFLLSAIKANADLYSQFRKTDCLLAKKYSNNYLNALYHFYLIFLTQSVFEKIIDRVKPSCIVSTSDYFPIDFAIYNTANNLGVGTYLVQHGILGISHVPFTSNYIFVHGELVKLELEKMNVHSERILALGMPSSDKLFLDYSTLRKKKFQNKKTYTILILSDTQGKSIYPEIYKLYEIELLRLVKSNPNINWKVKLHPAENKQFYAKSSFSELKNFHVLPTDTSLSDAFGNSDIAMTIWSTAGLEAMIVQKPLIVLDIHDDVYQYAWWPNYDGGIQVSKIIKVDGSLLINEIDFQELIEKQNIFLNNYYSNQQDSARAISNILLQ